MFDPEKEWECVEYPLPNEYPLLYEYVNLPFRRLVNSSSYCILHLAFTFYIYLYKLEFLSYKYDSYS